jgi:hypothetical protein
MKKGRDSLLQEKKICEHEKKKLKEKKKKLK